jgi:hypothetical protein
MNVFNIENAFRLKAERKWDTLYVVVDAHGTMIRPYHNALELYPEAIEVLQWFGKRKDFKLILWSSSYMAELEQIDSLCMRNKILFHYINQNPNENNTKMADFSKKFYFNILIDDKAGFEPETDWALIKKELIRLGEWDKTA